MEKQGRFFLLDGYALAYRSYFAFIRAPLINAKGQNTSAAYGFALTLLKILNEEKPDYLGVAFDSAGPTFRHGLYADYKATRQKMPEDMIYQVSWIKEMLSAMDIPTYEKMGFEADDIIGTLAVQARDAGFTVYLATGDKDFMQLIGDDIFFYNIRTKESSEEEKILGPEGVKKYLGVYPDAVNDLLALQGDSSDNIPGIPKVGEKTALKLLAEYKNLEGVLENADKISGKLGETIRANLELARLSHDLARIRTDVGLDVDLERFKMGKPDEARLAALFTELEFHSLIEKFGIGSHQIRFNENEQKYNTIRSKDELDRFIKELQKQKFFVFDTETTSLNPVNAELVGISFSWKTPEAWYIPVIAKEGKFFAAEELCGLLKPLMENENVRKGGQNLKYDISVLKKYGIETRGLEFDTLIASYVLFPEGRKHNLDVLAMDYLNYKKITTTSLIGTSRNQISMAEVPLPDISRYCCEDSEITLRLKNILEKDLRKEKLEKLFDEIEMPLVEVLSDMEMTGVSIDMQLLKRLSGEFSKELASLSTGIFELSGEEFNIDSPQQLGKILFEKLNIHKESGMQRIKKTKIGYSTDARVLEQFSGHPFVSKILDYRHLRKLKSTYIDALPELVNPKTGRIHTSYNQMITATGRLSSSDPNLQNIPVRTALGKQIRSAFIPSREGNLILSADYSQIEFRIAAYFSQDQRLIDAFKNNEDVHKRTAALIYNIPVDKVSKEQRNRAKEISFGILYGMNQYGLSSRLKISISESEEFLRTYFALLPGMADYIQRQLVGARRDGYVETMFGRKRTVPNIDSDNGRLKSLAEHIAVNTPIQGTAADIIKIAMIKIYSEMKKLKLESKMIMQVHDELVFDVSQNELDQLKALVRENMEGAADLDVPLSVEIGVGSNWLETK
jgi:DNA polymerase-1